MNERIRKLAEQAGFELQVNCGPLEGEGEIYYAREFEKFAELIVRECGQHLNSPGFIGRRDLDWAMVLNEYFGVE